MKSALLCLLLAAPLNGASILIDFGTVATPGSGPTWNNFTSLSDLTSYSLVDTNNAATGYAITLSGGAVNSLADNPTTTTATYSPFTPTTVIQDTFFQNAARTFTLSNFNPAVTYNITFYSYVNRDTTRSTNFSIPGYTTLTLEPSGNPIANSSGGQVGTISSISPDSGGNIAVTVTNNAGNWILSGMEITYTVPEPSSILLCTLGLIPLLRRRR